MNHFIAHRGWSDRAPENTHRAFQLAAEHPQVDMIELDVQETKDGELVVIHDFTVDRTTNGSGLVAAHTLAELKELVIKEKLYGQAFEERIPTLQEVFEQLPEDMLLDIEIKKAGDLYPTIEEKLVQLIVDHDMQDRVMITSFDHESIQKINQLNPSLRKGLLIYGRPVMLEEQLRATGSTLLAIHYSFLTKAVVDAMQQAGIEIGVWTVDDPQEMKRILDLDPAIRIATNDLTLTTDWAEA
ncbi:glycerophosphodiester phosphodiesterase [Alkalicoccus chagannorensis]|uniref:glycerophosphodiester phosphodiesterase n=1 Tax=Alkalicoccus chagannorensis TaxID=427072 RepID=UPI000400E6D1|nr:glycerophosphodiester phosphodiesterase family protein [Alkalicoccus chagannorensis]